MRIARGIRTICLSMKTRGEKKSKEVTSKHIQPIVSHRSNQVKQLSSNIRFETFRATFLISNFFIARKCDIWSIIKITFPTSWSHFCVAASLCICEMYTHAGTCLQTVNPFHYNASIKSMKYKYCPMECFPRWCF